MRLEKGRGKIHQYSRVREFFEILRHNTLTATRSKPTKREAKLVLVFDDKR